MSPICPKQPGVKAPEKPLLRPLLLSVKAGSPGLETKPQEQAMAQELYLVVRGYKHTRRMREFYR